MNERAGLPGPVPLSIAVGEGVEASFEPPEVIVVGGCAVRHVVSSRDVLRVQQLEGDGTLVIITQQARIVDSTRVKAFSLALEFPGQIPLGKALDAKTYLRSVLYKFGAHRVGYESTHCEGQMSFVQQPNGCLAARLELHFLNPRIDGVVRPVDRVDWRFEISADQLASPRGPQLED